MEEEHLRNIALFCSVAGICVLFFVSFWIDNATEIRKITIDDVGRGVYVCGNITSKRVYKNHIFMEIGEAAKQAF